MSTIPVPNIVEGAQQVANAPMNALASQTELQGMQQQQNERSLNMQMQRRQMADQDALTKAMTQYDPAKHSLADFGKLVTQNGGSGQAALNAQSGLVAQKQKYQQLSDEQFAHEQKIADLTQGVHDQVTAAPTEDKQNVYSQGLMTLARAGVDVSKESPQYPGDQAFEQHLAPIRLHSAILADAQKDRELTAKEQEAAAKIQAAQAQEQSAKNTSRRLDAEMPGGPLYAPPSEKEFQSYYQSYLGAKGQQPSAANEYAARQQYFKDKQPYAAQRIEIARESADRADRNSDRKDTDFIDKNYVKPANDAEKSYQMFMEAYNNRNNAKTGAESMLALSTHLATTFGNVKGSRVTKDMIQEHLGARGISDSALVAVQKLTNGDVLSPDQWDAFKGLISNSRNLSWQTAKKEAARRDVDISGSLPGDLSGKPQDQAKPTTASKASKYGVEIK